MNDQSKKYNVIKKLGEGSFGKVYLVKNIHNNSSCVLKSVYIETMGEEEIKNAVIEAKILEKLDHPNIIKFIESFIIKSPRKSLCIVMDYADNGDLKTKIMERKGKYFSENEILDMFTQLCLAIKHIHDRKILHRDIKAPNVLLTSTGLIKLGDFGVAKCLSFTIEKAKTFTGTPYYLSPEIVQNLPYSYKSDIWSLGVLLYEICTLKLPFEAKSIPLLTLKIINGEYKPIPDIYSKDLKMLVNSLLRVDSDLRPSIKEILKLNLIKNRIKLYLNENEYSDEFSHTIIHNFNPLEERYGSRRKESLEPKELLSKDFKEKKLSNRNIQVIEKKEEKQIQLIKHTSEDKRKLSGGVIVLNKKGSDDKKPDCQILNLAKIPLSSNFDDKNNKNNIRSPERLRKEEKSPDMKESPKIIKKDEKKLTDLLKIMNRKDISLDIKFAKNENSPRNNKKNDLKEYVNIHKMYVELNKIETDELNEENKEILPESAKISVNLHEEYKDDKFDEKENNEINEERNNDNVNEEDESEKQEIDNIKSDLQNKFGELYHVIYKVLDEMIPINAITFDKKNISLILVKKLSVLKADRYLINLAIQRISEFFSLILKERQQIKSK